jgi:prepilin-type processing-associated H-X9-DG protein
MLPSTAAATTNQYHYAPNEKLDFLDDAEKTVAGDSGRKITDCRRPSNILMLADGCRNPNGNSVKENATCNLNLPGGWTDDSTRDMTKAPPLHNKRANIGMVDGHVEAQGTNVTNIHCLKHGGTLNNGNIWDFGSQ